MVVKSIRFSGATDLVPEAQLQQVVAYAIGKKLDFAGLEALASKVIDALHAQGWFLADAYLPQQDVTTGALEIAIRAGHLDGANGNGSPFTVEPKAKSPLRIHRSRLEDIAAPLLPAGAVVKKGDLERALLLMNDLPGITARARLKKGENPDSTHVAIDVSEGPLLGAGIWGDNYGNYSTGGPELNLSAQLNDPARIGDQLTLRATHSEGLDLQRLGYRLPLGHRGLRVGVNARNMSYRVRNGLGKDSGLNGDSTTYGATASYPIIRSRRLNLYADGGYDYKQLKDVSDAGVLDDKRVKVWNVGLSGNRLDTLGGLTSWSAVWKAADLDLSHDAADATNDASGYQTAGHYNTLDYALSRLQKLPGAFTLYAHLSGQVADKNLDSSAQFILGGPYGVRAYPVGEASGDEGWLTNLELRYNIPTATALGNLQMMAFFDTGEVTLHHSTNDIAIPTATGRNHYHLSGWGLGVNLQKSGSHTVRLIWAQTIGDNPGRTPQGNDADNHSNDSRFWLQVILRI